jgi:hypothetical protein
MFLAGGVTDRESLVAAMRGASSVIHLAGCHRSVHAADFCRAGFPQDTTLAGGPVPAGTCGPLESLLE